MKDFASSTAKSMQQKGQKNAKWKLFLCADEVALFQAFAVGTDLAFISFHSFPDVWGRRKTIAVRAELIQSPCQTDSSMVVER